ncbi:hypothetical protein RKD27_004436 [Streptomyces sp. SAI-126]
MTARFTLITSVPPSIFEASWASNSSGLDPINPENNCNIRQWALCFNEARRSYDKCLKGNAAEYCESQLAFEYGICQLRFGCTAGSKVCTSDIRKAWPNGTCCDSDLKACGGICLHCEEPRYVNFLECTCECPPDTPDECSGDCVDKKKDPDHCGECGKTCAAGEACCKGVCVNAASDPGNCGGCGQRCPPLFKCKEGVCIDPCPGGKPCPDKDGNLGGCCGDSTAMCTLSPGGSAGCCRPGCAGPEHCPPFGSAPSACCKNCPPGKQLINCRCM